MSTKYKKFIKRVKKTIKRQPIPPKYNPDEWKDKTFNCYLYALRACMNFDYDGYLICPGFISKGKELFCHEYTAQSVLRDFKEDCKSLGLEVFPSTLTEKIGNNEYKIAVYVNTGYDYHFVRQDSDGKWSEKDGWNKEIEIVDEDEISKCRRGYKFIQIFRVSKK